MSYQSVFVFTFSINGEIFYIQNHGITAHFLRAAFFPSLIEANSFIWNARLSQYEGKDLGWEIDLTGKHIEGLKLIEVKVPI